jgi:hypothetical protein
MQKFATGKFHFAASYAKNLAKSGKRYAECANSALKLPFDTPWSAPLNIGQPTPTVQYIIFLVVYADLA